MSKEKIYRAFYPDNPRLYYNQLKEMTGLSYSSLQNTLSRLLETKQIRKEKTRSNVFYQITERYRSIEFTRIAIDKMEYLNTDVKIPVKEFSKQCSRAIHAAIIFGSASLGQETEGSDIDILIILESFDTIQNNYEKEIKRWINHINIISLYPLSIFYTSLKDFQKQEDHLLKEAKATGFPIVNQQKYFEAY